MDMGADGFEPDVHMSADGELVVIRDETVDRTTDGTGFVEGCHAAGGGTEKQIKTQDGSPEPSLLK